MKVMPDTTDKKTTNEVVTLTAEIVGAYIMNNNIPATELANLINNVHVALNSVNGIDTVNAQQDKTPQKPAVPIKKSIQNDFLVCLEDGKRFKTLKRHLRARYGMSPEDYRRKWGLKPSYPMVAPAYAERRSELAKKRG